jgi:hypothetical protein
VTIYSTSDTSVWRASWRADPSARRIADNHYNRQSPDSDQFVPPGRCVVLVIPEVAFWVTSWPFSEYVKHAWPGAWICSAFRNERRDLHRSSDLITEAVAATMFYWSPPSEGMVTFVDPKKTRPKRDPGRCFRRAGFEEVGETKGGLIALRLSPDDMPRSSKQPVGAQGALEFTPKGAA